VTRVEIGEPISAWLLHLTRSGGHLILAEGRRKECRHGTSIEIPIQPPRLDPVADRPGGRRPQLRDQHHLDRRQDLRLIYGAGDRAQAEQRLHRWLTFCADSDVPELHRLAGTIDSWRPELLPTSTPAASPMDPPKPRTC
jgi:hypothetical protein